MRIIKHSRAGLQTLSLSLLVSLTLTPLNLFTPAWAHCGMENCPVAAASQSLTQSSASAVGSVSTLTKKGIGTDSLWGNMLLGMAFQRDAELQSLSKKSGRADALTLGSVAAISGLGLASGITAMATLQDEPHPGGPVILGIVGSALSLGSLAARIGVNHHYQKKIRARQLALQAQVETVLSHYEQNQVTDTDRQALTTLVGERARNEFNQLWKASH